MVPLPLLWETLRPLGGVHLPPAHPHWGETLPVQGVSALLQRTIHHDLPPEDARRRADVPLHRLWPLLLHAENSVLTHGAAQGPAASKLYHRSDLHVQRSLQRDTVHDGQLSRVCLGCLWGLTTLVLLRPWFSSIPGSPPFLAVLERPDDSVAVV